MPHSSTFHFNKFDVAERQLNQAIHLFFSGGDPVSVHTLAEAAAQVLYDIRHQFGAESKIRDSDLVKPECKKEWLESLFQSRNFFKHADRDATSTHEFKEEFNHFSLLDAVTMYLAAKRAWTPETIVFNQWFGVTYPTLVRQGTGFGTSVERYRSDPSAREPESYRALCLQAITELRNNHRPIPGVTLAEGLPSDA